MSVVVTAFIIDEPTDIEFASADSWYVDGTPGTLHVIDRSGDKDRHVGVFARGQWLYATLGKVDQTAATTPSEEALSDGEGEFWTVAEVAAYLGVPEGSVYAWNHKGTGPRRARVGRHLRYRRADVESWLESNAT